MRRKLGKFRVLVSGVLERFGVFRLCRRGWPDMAAGYAAMAEDQVREADAAAWGEGFIGDVADEQVRPG